MALFDIVKTSILHNQQLKKDGKYVGIPIPFERLAKYIPITERGHSIGLLGATGCLSGDTLIKVIRCNRHAHREYRIDHLYKLFHNRYRKSVSGIQSTKVQSYKYDINATGYHEIEDVVQSGIKDVYRVITSSGKTIKSTMDHRYMVAINHSSEDNNFKKLSELSIGDSIYVKSPKIVNGRKKRTRYLSNDYMDKMPYYYNCSIKLINGKYPYQRVAWYRLVYDAYINGLTVEEFLHTVKTNPNHSLTFSDRNYDIHHKDKNKLNNSIDNLILLTKEEHNKLHADYKRLGLYNVHTEQIISIDYIGKEMTYDIVCKDPYHNFIANEFIVHNSGKSRFVRWLYVYNSYKFHKQTGYPVKIFLFPLEDSKEKVYRNLICHYLYDIYGIFISLQELDSKGDRMLPQWVSEKLEEAKEFFDEFEKIVTIIDGIYTPTEIYKYLEQYALSTGKIQTITINTEGKPVKQQRYIAENNVHTIIVLDNMSNIDVEEGAEDERQAIVRLGKKYVRERLCNFFNFTVVQVLQQDFASERQSFTKDGSSIVAKLEPSLASIGDSKTIARSLHLCLGLFNPSRFGLIQYPIPSKHDPQNTYRIDLLGNRFRTLTILKSNDSDFGMRIPFDFSAINEVMTELPLPKTAEIEDIYRKIREKDEGKFTATKNVIIQTEIEAAINDDEPPF